jgi:hypothetical protein
MTTVDAVFLVVAFFVAIFAGAAFFDWLISRNGRGRHKADHGLDD